MGVDWDSHLLSPLHDVFGDEHEYRPRNGTPFTINGIFDRGYAQVAENLDGDSEINTSSPMLGVRDAEFRKLGKSQPAVNAPQTTIKYSLAGASYCGDPLASWGNKQLECSINKIAPSHLNIIFNYS